MTALELEFDHETLRLRIALDGETLVDDILDPDGRRRFASAIEQYIQSLDDNPVSARLDRLPLRVVGDGRTPRYQDQEAGYTTLHGSGSLAALAAAVAESPALAEQRFRSNIAIDGPAAWEEQTWVGRGLRIGDVEYEVVSPRTRCLATHANPLTGKRDLPIMQTLLQLFPSERPTFAIAMTANRGGTIRVGDRVELKD